MYGNMYGTMTRMLRTTVYLTPELKADVERVARLERRSEAEVIRAALARYAAAAVPRPRLPLWTEPTDPSLAERVDELLDGFGES